MLKKLWNFLLEKTYFVAVMYPDAEGEWQYSNHVVAYRRITPENFLAFVADLKESNEYQDVMVLTLYEL